jgi:hypothetical protein
LHLLSHKDFWSIPHTGLIGRTEHESGVTAPLP